MSAFAKFFHFDEDGKVVEAGTVTLPSYLDWMPIDPKAYWFLQRGYGSPQATHTLFESQGERLLLSVNKSLSFFNHKEMKERENGIEERVQRYIDENGISRDPRNQ